MEDEREKLRLLADKLLKKDNQKKSPKKKRKSDEAHPSSWTEKYESTRNRMRKVLTDAGKYKPELSEQLTLCARTSILCKRIWDELSEMEKLIYEEKSREGDIRKKITPLVSAYLMVESAHRRNLRSLKMNKELENKDVPEPPEEDDALAELMRDD